MNARMGNGKKDAMEAALKERGGISIRKGRYHAPRPRRALWAFSLAFAALAIEGRALLLLDVPPVGIEDFEAELEVATPINPGPFLKPDRTDAHPLLILGSLMSFLMNGLGKFSSSLRS